MIGLCEMLVKKTGLSRKSAQAYEINVVMYIGQLSPYTRYCELIDLLS